MSKVVKSPTLNDLVVVQEWNVDAVVRICQVKSDVRARNSYSHAIVWLNSSLSSMLVVLHVVLLSADEGVKSTFATDNKKSIVEKTSVTILDVLLTCWMSGELS